MAEATNAYFCGSCHSEVEGRRNPHRVRNTTAANFAAANLAQMSSDFSAFGATGPYVCPYCGGEVKPGHTPREAEQRAS
jgi:ribosomal protein L24E